MSLAIFDLDNTLIADDSDYLWGQFLVDQGVVFLEDRPMAGKQPLHVARLDPLERLDEVGDAAAVMGVDRADAAVAVDVVAREEQVAEAEAELAVGVAGGQPDLEL